MLQRFPAGVRRGQQRLGGVHERRAGCHSSAAVAVAGQAASVHQRAVVQGTYWGWCGSWRFRFRVPTITTKRERKRTTVLRCKPDGNACRFGALVCAGAARAARPLHEHHVEHLPDDEAGHTHVDPFRHLAVPRAMHIRHVQHVAQRRGAQADHGLQEEAVRRRHSCFYHKTVMARAPRRRCRLGGTGVRTFRFEMKTDRISRCEQ